MVGPSPHGTCTIAYVSVLTFLADILAHLQSCSACFPNTLSSEWCMCVSQGTFIRN